MLTSFAAQERWRFQEDPKAAKKLCGADSEDAAERATWTAVARAVMNLDEWVTRD
jgi:hypothetical protein